MQKSPHSCEERRPLWLDPSLLAGRPALCPEESTGRDWKSWGQNAPKDLLKEGDSHPTKLPMCPYHSFKSQLQCPSLVLRADRHADFSVYASVTLLRATHPHLTPWDHRWERSQDTTSRRLLRSSQMGPEPC